MFAPSAASCQADGRLHCIGARLFAIPPLPLDSRAVPASYLAPPYLDIHYAVKEADPGFSLPRVFH